jgi:hypothetical protein
MRNDARNFVRRLGRPGTPALALAGQGIGLPTSVDLGARPPKRERPSAPPAAVLTLGELVGMAAVLAVGAVAVVSLALAQTGHHDGWLAVGLGLGLAAALFGGTRLFGRWPAMAVDPVEIGLLVATAAAAVLFFVPGFPYASADKDPGVYVAHGFAIARTGGVDIADPAYDRGLVTADFPGEWPGDGTAVTSQFYHLPSALYATALDVAGRQAFFDVTPALAVLSVLIVVLAARRATNTWAAAITGALLVTSMLQVWQAKMPSNEVPAQLFLAGSLLAGVLAIDRRWIGGAFAAGLFLSLGFLTRPDGFLYMLLALGLVSLGLAISGRFDRRAGALFAGLGVGLPYAFWNAYVARADYSASNSVPGAPKLVLVGAAIVGLGGAARSLSVWWTRRRAADGGGAEAGAGLDVVGLVRRYQLPLGMAVLAAAAATLGLFWFRMGLFGPGTTLSPHHDGVVPSYDERNLWWLALFTTRPGLVLMWLGLGVLLLTRAPRSRPAAYLLAMPAVLLPLYLYDARISMRMMWWGRRFVPAVLPAIALLTALALAWALCHRLTAVKVAGAVATAFLVLTTAGQSWPLRHHQEMAGSWEIANGVAQVAGDDQGVFLFTGSKDLFDPMRNSPLMVWWALDEVAAKLPPDYDLATIEAYRDAFPDQPVYLVLHDEPLPEQLPADRFTQVRELAQPLTYWEESITDRPDESFTHPRGLTIWQLTTDTPPTAAATRPIQPA